MSGIWCDAQDIRGGPVLVLIFSRPEDILDVDLLVVSVLIASLGLQVINLLNW